jgi:hypothetical protein
MSSSVTPAMKVETNKRKLRPVKEMMKNARQVRTNRNLKPILIYPTNFLIFSLRF